LIAEISPSLPAVLADATQIQQVLLNLVSNAAAAIGPKAGRVVVGLSEVLIDAELTERHPNFLPVKAVRLSVRDNGPGIEPTILDRIFEPFFTTKGPGQGTGLGLSVVHGIVRSHEGIIEVHSESSEGTEFEIYLPACTSPVQANSSNSFPEEAAPLVVPTKLKGTILLVDDEGSLLQVTTKILQHHGFEVIPASSPSEALELFQHSAHLIELIITDYAMPGCNGVDFARQIHGLRRSMPIILCSGHGVGIHRERALELGFREFLTKPISMDKLISVVSRLLSNTVKAD
jgi:CheY-like chemotaxis protein/anti-sigma regulatory factor (Ser/Thr protein kinase)